MKYIRMIVETLIMWLASSMVLLIAIAYLMENYVLNIDMARLCVNILYGLPALTGGILVSKRLSRQKVLWAGFSGMIYCTIIIGISYITRGKINANMITLICSYGSSIAGGLIGGIIGK